MQLLFSKLSKQRSSSDRFCHGSAQNQNLGANGITVMGWWVYIKIQGYTPLNPLKRMMNWK